MTSNKTNDELEGAGSPIPKFVTPPCDLCPDVSVVMIRAPYGCTCIANVYQRRCTQHLQRASDTLEEFEIVEDYTVDRIFLQKVENEK